MDTKNLSADAFDACKKSYARLVGELVNKSDELLRFREETLDMRDAAVSLFWQSAQAHWQEEVRKHPDLKLDTREHEVLGVLVARADKPMRVSVRLQEFEKELPDSRDERKDLIYCAIMFQDHSPIEGTILEQWMKNDESLPGFYKYEILKTFSCGEIGKAYDFFCDSVKRCSIKQKNKYMEELIYSVEDVFGAYLEKGNAAYYNIPEYQRGYKWTAENARVLLSDLKKFHESSVREERCGIMDSFYCLQNITLFKNDAKNCYNVVDGQQRLTTLMILLAWLDRAYLVADKLKYSVREDTHHFIQDYVLTKKIWEDPTVEVNHKDEFYIRQVAKAIAKWFDDEEKDWYEANKETFTTTILKKTRLIVNLLDGEEERIFANLNGGKVPLDGADLLRAVLITHSAKEKVEPVDFDEGSYELRENLYNEYRVRMGMELDAMNAWWSRKEVRTFYEQFIPDKVMKEAVGHFDYKKFPINLLYMLYFSKEAQEGDAFSFRFFEYGMDKNEWIGDDNWEMYVDIKRLHEEMQEWFADKTIYHYLGYLFFRYKGRKLENGELTFQLVYKQWGQSASKEEFKSWLKQQIRYLLLTPYQKEGEVYDGQKLEQAFLDDIKKIDENDWYGGDKNLISVLIFMDVCLMLQSKSMDRLPVEAFRSSGEDIEHILSQTPNEEDTIDENTYERNVAFLRKLKVAGKISDEELKDFEGEYSPEKADKMKRELNRIGLNSIGNLVLLHESINRGYGNDSYLVKREKITRHFFGDNEKKRYIRPHTLNVFVKSHEKRDHALEDWSVDDISKNANIAETIKTWMIEK